jgi:hypothetical protein
MAPEDRDRIFEKALARHLRAGVPGSNASGEPGASPSACPDSEILAAYHERSLAAEQMINFKEHIATCGRCQQILAQLEVTDELSAQADQPERQEQKVVSMPARDPELAEAAAAAPAAAPRASRVAKSRWRSKALHGANWRWLAPAGAIAAGLLLWVALHENYPTSFEVAKNTHTVPAAAPPQGSPAEQKSVAEEPPSAVPQTRSNARPDADDQVRGKIAAAVPAPALKKDQASLDRKSPAQQQSGAAQAPASASPGPIGGVVSGNVNQPNVTADNRLESEEKQPVAPPPSPTAPAAEQDQYATSLETAPASKAAAAPKSKAIAGAAGRQAPQQQDTLQAATSQLREATPLRVAKARGSGIVTVAAPDSTAFWNIGPAGIIERSADRDATRTIQVSGVVTDLTAGSAPSDKVCWIVGRSGTVLRTTDGGQHWLKVPSPTGDDLASVFAVDAEQATIGAAVTKKTYKTTDAGQTWTSVPSP